MAGRERRSRKGEVKFVLWQEPHAVRVSKGTMRFVREAGATVS